MMEENNNNKADCILEVTAYENMGNEQLVYFKLQEKLLIVRRKLLFDYMNFITEFYNINCYNINYYPL